jgi:hypothetical protein
VHEHTREGNIESFQNICLALPSHPIVMVKFHPSVQFRASVVATRPLDQTPVTADSKLAVPNGI